MHIEFDPAKVDWLAYTHPSSDDNLYQFGGGSYTAFAGVPYQRGAGIGSIFRSLLRYLIPIGKQAGAAIGRQGLESGVRVLSNVLDGRDVRQSLEDEGRSGLKSLLDKASLNLSKKAEAASAANQSGGSSAFDFRRYKKQLSSAASDSINSFKPENAAADNTTIGPFTQVPKTINKRRVGKRKLPYSSIGPPLLPSIATPSTTKKQRRSSKKRPQQQRGRNIRIDSLGAY